MKRSGFTMIELIFVIVILGILAAVAIPKLTATRDDAKISKLASNLSTLLSDSAAFYTSQGNNRWSNALWENVTNVEVDGPGSAITVAVNLESDPTVPCFEVQGTTDGNLTITTVGTDTICTGAAQIAGSITDTGTGVIHQIGGQGVVR